MAASENSQHAIRRSTRLPLEVPVRVTSLSADYPFSESCHTTLVNAHGCGLISPGAIAKGIQVRIEIVSAGRHTTARVAEVVPLGGQPETWLVGLELDTPGNFWGIEYAPSDWKVEEGREAARPMALEAEKRPPAGRRWRLSDISTGACYLESAAPFSHGTPVLISVRALEKEYLLEGVVRASHPQTGMGVEFTRAPGQRERVQELIGELASGREAPRIFVGRKEGQRAAKELNDDPADSGRMDSGPTDTEPGDFESDDPLLDLVRQGLSLAAEQFLSDLRAQRLGKRMDPRMDIALPVLLAGTDVKGRPLDQRVMTINISRRGALLEGIHGMLSPGDKISLARGRKKEEYLVAWVADDKTAAGARIAVTALDPNSSFWDELLPAASESVPGSVSD
jgi:PilZ domain-containing protein